MLTIDVDVVSAVKSLYSGKARRVFAPGAMGEIGVLPKHAPFLSTLRPGEVRIEGENGETEHIYVSGGIVEVQPHTITILSDTATRAHDLDEARCLEAKTRAEEVMANADTDVDITKVKVSILELSAQLKLIEKLRKQKN